MCGPPIERVVLFAVLPVLPSPRNRSRIPEGAPSVKKDVTSPLVRRLLAFALQGNLSLQTMGLGLKK
jgi:hypothetical protein